MKERQANNKTEKFKKSGRMEEKKIGEKYSNVALLHFGVAEVYSFEECHHIHIYGYVSLHCKFSLQSICF